MYQIFLNNSQTKYLNAILDSLAKKIIKMNEHKIIESLKRIADHPSSLKLEDDVFDKNNSLIASIDTYNEKVHYLNFKKPELIIKKVIRSSISDIISRSVSPKYLLISFSGTKSNFSNKNIKKIVNSINQEKKEI